MRVELTNGRVRIPPRLAINVLKPKLGQVAHVLAEKFPGIRWEKGQWSVIASPAIVEKVNDIFDTKLKVPVKKKEKIDFPFKTDPRDYQIEALQDGWKREGFAYLMEPGLGKTKVAIDDAQINNRAGLIDTVIVLCPKSIIPTWLREIGTHGHWDQDGGWEVSWWDPDFWDQDRRYKVENAPKKPTMRWLIIGIDTVSVSAKCWDFVRKWLYTSSKVMAIVDESTTIKNVEAGRTVRTMEIGVRCEKRRILTGSPIATTPLDLYSQFLFLDEQTWLGRSYRSFENHFAIKGGFKNREIMGYINQNELMEIVGENSYRATTAEHLDLPPQTFQTREVPLSPKVRKIYKAICDEVLLTMAGEKLNVDLVVQKVSKCRQLVGGYMLPDWPIDPETEKPIKKGTRIAQLIHQDMEDELVATLQENDRKAIIWAYYRHEIEAICDRLRKEGYRPVAYHGDLSVSERKQVEDDFERNDKFDVFVGQVECGGMGLTLNEATLMVYFSNSRYPLWREQSERRNYRYGQEFPTTVVDLFISGTIGQTIYEGVTGKIDLNRKLLEATRNPGILKEILMPKKASGWRM